MVGGNTDLSDPVLTGITIDKSVVDVSSGSQTISVELSVADESKIKNAKAWFQHVETGNIRTESIHGEYDAGLLPPIEWTVDQSTQAGMWELFRIDIDDTATNHMYLYPNQLTGQNFPIEVVGGGYRTHPRPTKAIAGLRTLSTPRNRQATHPLAQLAKATVGLRR